MNETHTGDCVTGTDSDCSLQSDFQLKVETQGAFGLRTCDEYMIAYTHESPLLYQSSLEGCHGNRSRSVSITAGPSISADCREN